MGTCAVDAGANVNEVRPDGPLVDLMGGALRRQIRVHEHGMVALVDVMPRLVSEGQTADAAIVQAARVSYGAGTKKISEDRGLIRYLMRHRHTTPLEMVEFKFHVALPIFVARQWIRHRTANVNEYSARYSIVPDRFYTPALEDVRAQSAVNRQGRGAPIDEETAERFVAYLAKAEALHRDYLELTERGLARELARIGLPQSVYTEWYWKIDLHNLLHFLSLRLDAHAQQEIRDYARAILRLIEPIAPITVEAFRDYRMGAVTLTRLEAEAVREGRAELACDNAREQREWAEKRKTLGLDKDE